ncbi:hypothetical protein EDC01DRAFT_719362 [Geopyxis carbonaria]|nr:hypothetical protein EDC01DRAFT_719362 [Geopyxis carbonaria]
MKGWTDGMNKEHIYLHNLVSVCLDFLTKTVTATTTISAKSSSATPSASSAPSTGYTNLTSSDLKILSNLALALKTGATEASIKLPPHLLSTLPHLPNHLLFSDLPQKLGPHTLHDSLRTFNATLVKNLPDFAHYRSLHAWGASFRDPRTTPVQGDAWTLDKYKNLHIAEATVKVFPRADWFAFIDADTYVMAHNLALLLSVDSLKPKEPHYIGSVALYQGTRFGHGGSGYLVSSAAMEPFRGHGLAERFEARTAGSCCGDHIFAVAIQEAGGHAVQDARPALNGDPPHGLWFDAGRMCRAVVTMHHMHPAEMLAVWEWERRAARPGVPLLHRDVFDRFVAPEIRESREGWDNWTEGRVEAGVERWEGCKERCASWEGCVQWRWKAGECSMGETVRLGVRVVEEGGVWWRCETGGR